MAVKSMATIASNMVVTTWPPVLLWMLPKIPIGAMGWVMTRPMMMMCQSVSVRRRRGAPGDEGVAPVLIVSGPYGPRNLVASFLGAGAQESRRALVQAMFVHLFRQHGKPRGAEDSGIGAQHSASDTRAR